MRRRGSFPVGALVAASCCGSVQAAELLAGSLNSGGGQATSANYSLESSLGEVIGGQSAGGNVALTSGGTSVQPSSAKSLALNAAPVAVDEGNTSQLTGSAIMDDDSVTLLAGTDISWSIVSGPIIALSQSGLLTTDAVYANRNASVVGTWMGATNSTHLLVINSQSDNFRSYAGDSLPDDWQVQYFGENNPQAAPDADATGTGQNNRFKYIAGLNPIDPASRFVIRIHPVVSQPGQQQIIFSPLAAGRTYTLSSNTSLSATNWSNLTGTIQIDNDQQRTVIDPNATGPVKFYRVEIAKP